MTTLGVCLLALLVYTYVGYPLCVACWARLFPRHFAAKDDFEPEVSICLAVSNGAAHLEQKLDSLLGLEYPRDKLEILICSDGSTDQSREIVERRARSDPRIQLLENAMRRGKPTALNRLRQAARGEILVFTDVRQPISSDAVRALVRVLADPAVGCVSGNLLLSGTTGAGAYWRYERFIRSAEGALGSLVGVSGALYALRRSDLPELPADLILDDMFVPLSVASSGKSVVFAPAARAYDAALDDDREFPRKVRTLAGNYQLVLLMPRLLLPGLHRMWFQVVSHKLLRLVCPWALLGLLALSLGLAVSSRVWLVLLAGQLGFYGLAAGGARFGALGRLARTFVVLNAAAVVGFWRFLRGAQPVTW